MTLDDLKILVKNQTMDEGLWFYAQTGPEEYLQQELRRLHGMCKAVIDDVKDTKWMSRMQSERDRAIGAVLLMAHNGVITSTRAAELLGMSLLDIREELGNDMDA